MNPLQKNLSPRRLHRSPHLMHWSGMRGSSDADGAALPGLRDAIRPPFCPSSYSGRARWSSVGMIARLLGVNRHAFQDFLPMFGILAWRLLGFFLLITFIDIFFIFTYVWHGICS
jgi:hypothetical protein